VYGLGATLYHLLTGFSPFEGDTLSVMERVRQGDFPRPRQREPSVPRPLEAICLGAMALEPEDRYASSRGLAEDVEHWMADEPVSAYRDSATERLWRWIRRRRALAQSLLAALVVLAVTASITAVLVNRQRREAEAARRVAVAEREKATRLAGEKQQLAEQEARVRSDAQQLANALITEVHDRIAKLPGATPIRQFLVQTAMDYLGRLDVQSSGDPSLILSLSHAYLKVGDVQGNDNVANLGDTAGALASYRKSLDLLKQVIAAAGPSDALDNRLASVHDRIGFVQWQMGEADEALKHFQRALDLAKRHAESEPENTESLRTYWVALNRMGDFKRRQGQLSEAQEWHKQALEIASGLHSKLPDNSDVKRDVAISLSLVGRVQRLTDDMEGALETLRRQLAVMEEIQQADPESAGAERDVAYALSALSRVETELEHYDDASAHARRSLEILAKLIDLDPQNSQYLVDRALGYERLGTIQSEQGLKTEALSSFQTQLAIREELAQNDPESSFARNGLAVALNAVGEALEELGRLEEALENYQRYLELKRELVEHDPTHVGYRRGVAVGLQNVGIIQEILGHYAEAEESYLESLQIREALAGSADPQDPQPNQDLAYSCKLLAWLRATCPEDQRRDGDAAVELARRACDLTGWDSSHSLDRLAASYAEAGQFAEAVRWQAEAVELAGDETKAERQQRLDLYRRNQPYRQTTEPAN
jgi:tetratricopeptide (TPR) repeat protein